MWFFFCRKVTYLGYEVSEKGIHADPEKLRALTTWPVPKNIKEVITFLGFTGYYGIFVKDYAKIVKPTGPKESISFWPSLFWPS